MVRTVKNPNEILTEWLVAGLQKNGKDVAGLAKRLKIHPSAIYKLMAGTRDFHLTEIKPIADYIDEPIPDLWGTPKK